MEPTTIENWLKVSTLGAGAFGVVTLWKNNETNDFIGKIFALVIFNIILKFHYIIFKSDKKM